MRFEALLGVKHLHPVDREFGLVEPEAGMTQDVADRRHHQRPAPVPPVPAKLRMLVSRTRPAPEAVAVAATIDAELIGMGSAGAKAMAVVRGEADIYLHSGGQYEWDSCAPVALALAHGLHASRIDGSPLVYNQADVYMPDLLICRKNHAAMVLTAVADLSRTTPR